MNDINPEISPEPEGTPDSADERIPTDRRPLGFWLRAVDALISREFDTAFADEGDGLASRKVQGNITKHHLRAKFDVHARHFDERLLIIDIVRVDHS